MKWTRARKLGLTASIAPIFMLFSYFISFITVDIGILASKETDLLELIKTANEYADMLMLACLRQFPTNYQMCSRMYPTALHR